MGDLLFLGMIVGGVGGAIKNNSNSSINDACDAFNKVNEEFENTLNNWKTNLNQANIDLAEAKAVRQQLVTSNDLYKSAMNSTKDAFRQTELITMITIGVFIFSIITTFLLRYFNVYSNIWNYFVKKK